MRKNIGIGMGIGIVVLAVSAGYFVHSNDENSPPASLARTGVANAPRTEVRETTTPAASHDSPPLQPESRTQANHSARVAESPVKESPNRNLLNEPRGEEFKRLVKSLRLSATDSERLLDILADELKRIREGVAAHRAFISQEEANALRAESDRLAIELLSYDKFQRYDDYRNHPAERKQIDRLNERLVSNESEALYQEIEDQLYAAIKEETSRTPAPRLSAYGSHIEYETALKKWRDDNMHRFQERAAVLLTPTQFAALQSVAR